MGKTKEQMSTSLESGESAITGAPAIESGSAAKRGTVENQDRVLIVSKATNAMIEFKRKGVLVKQPFAVRVLDGIAAHLGMKKSDDEDAWYEVETSNPVGTMKVRVKGSYRAKFVQVPLMRGTTWEKTGRGYRRWVRIPVPGNANISNIAAFLKDTITDNKPPGFRSPDGYYYSLKFTSTP